MRDLPDKSIVIEREDGAKLRSISKETMSYEEYLKWQALNSMDFQKEIERVRDTMLEQQAERIFNDLNSPLNVPQKKRGIKDVLYDLFINAASNVISNGIWIVITLLVGIIIGHYIK